MEHLGRTVGSVGAGGAGFLERSDLAGRPVGREGLADHPVVRDGPPFAAVRAGAAVVAHHEVVTVGDRDLLGQVAGGAAVVHARVGLLQGPAVDVDTPAAHIQPVAAHAHDSLDEVRVRAAVGRTGAGGALRVLDATGVGVSTGGGLEHEHAAPLVVAGILGEPVDPDPPPDLGRRHH